jgi:transcriptional regulator with XRE-family HTH domain
MKRGDNNPTLGAYVRERRLSRNLSIPEAADRSGLDDSYWRKLEHGHYQSPDAKTLRIVADTIECPLEDLYGLCGYTIADDLPALTPYLRTKFDLPPEAVSDMEKYFAQLRSYYGIPEDQPVFPPQDRSARTSKRTEPSKEARNRADHPWRGPADRRAA